MAVGKKYVDDKRRGRARQRKDGGEDRGMEKVSRRWTGQEERKGELWMHREKGKRRDYELKEKGKKIARQLSVLKSGNHNGNKRYLSQQRKKKKEKISKMGVWGTRGRAVVCFRGRRHLLDDIWVKGPLGLDASKEEESAWSTA